MRNIIGISTRCKLAIDQTEALLEPLAVAYYRAQNEKVVLDEEFVKSLMVRLTQDEILIAQLLEELRLRDKAMDN